MKEKEFIWYKIAESINEILFAENNLAVVRVKGKRMCLARFHDNLFAIAYTCPHAGGMLADGYIDGLGNVVCPAHRYKYDLNNGRNISGDGYYLKTWPVEVKENGVYIVGMEPAPGLWNLF